MRLYENDSQIMSRLGRGKFTAKSAILLPQFREAISRDQGKKKICYILSYLGSERTAVPDYVFVVVVERLGVPYEGG